MVAQVHIYDDGRIHVQEGSMGSYTKFDLNPSANERKALQCFYDCQIAKGNYGRSFADTDTKYVPVEVTTKTVRVVRAMSPASSIEVAG